MRSLSDYQYLVLAMDAYNRGYNQQVTTPDGNLPTLDAEIGDFTLVATSAELEPAGVGQSADFYATAYETGDEIVISYRGADHLFDPSPVPGVDFPDVANEVLGTDTEQIKLAVRFYKEVVLPIALQTGKHVVLTGHSLGGGLAGVVASVYHLDAIGFNNIGFMGSAHAISELAGDPSNDYSDLLYDGGTPDTPAVLSYRSVSLDGEIASGWREHGYYTEQVLDLADDETLNDGARHAIGLLGIVDFGSAAKDENGNNIWEDGKWQKAEKVVFADLVDDDVAKATGIANVGTNPASGAMQQMIAYSGLGGEEKPFGNAAVATFVAEIEELGKAVDGGLSDAAAAVAGMALTQYAGWLAKNAVVSSDHDGVLTQESGYLRVDLTSDRWAAGADPNSEGSTPPEMLAFNEISKGVEQSYGFTLTDLGGAAGFNVIDFATGGSFSGDVPAAGENETILFIGTDATDTVNGTDGDDFIMGNLGINGSGGDTINGGDGNDLILGDRGGDVIDGGEGVDLIDGGEGNDTITLHHGDIAIGGDAVDTDTYTVNLDEWDPSNNLEVIVTGQGEDDIKITSSRTGVNVAVVHVGGLTEKEALGIDTAALKGLLAQKGIGADVVIVNPEDTDKIYFNDTLGRGRQLSSDLFLRVSLPRGDVVRQHGLHDHGRRDGVSNHGPDQGLLLGL